MTRDRDWSSLYLKFFGSVEKREERINSRGRFMKEHAARKKRGGDKEEETI